MKKSRYAEEQIAFALKQAETGTPVAEVIRRMGVSEQTFYRWKVYGRLGATSAQRTANANRRRRRQTRCGRRISSRTRCSTGGGCERCSGRRLHPRGAGDCRNRRD